LNHTSLIRSGSHDERSPEKNKTQNSTKYGPHTHFKMATTIIGGSVAEEGLPF